MSTPTRLRMDPVLANSIAFSAASLEAVALRVRKSIGTPDSHRILDWAKVELERLGGELVELTEVARQAEREGA